MPRPKINKKIFGGRKELIVKKHAPQTGGAFLNPELIELKKQLMDARESYMRAIGMGDKEAYKISREHLVEAGQRLRAAEIAGALHKGQVPGKRIAESDLSQKIVERIADAQTKAVRHGTDERHKKRGKFALTLTPELGPGLHLMDIFSATGSSKLNFQLQEKLGASGIYEFVNQVGERMLGERARGENEMERMRESKKFAAQVLRENADYIWPRLWLSNGVAPKTIFEEIRARKRIENKFTEPEELEKLIQVITKINRGFPGWLAIEHSERELNAVAHGTLHKLTAQEVIQKIGPKLQAKAAELEKMRTKMLNAIEEERAAKEAAKANTREAKANELARTVNEAKKAMALFKAQGKIRVNPGVQIKHMAQVTKEPKNSADRYVIQGNSIRYFGKDKQITYSSIFQIGGLQITFNLAGELRVINGTTLRLPTKQESEAIGRRIEGVGRVNEWNYVILDGSATFRHGKNVVLAKEFTLGGKKAFRGPKGRVYVIGRDGALQRNA